MSIAVQLSKRGAAVPASPIRRLVPYADKARAEGSHVYSLNIGQPDIHTPEEMIQAFKNTDDTVLAYGPSDGLPVLKEAISHYWKQWDIDISPEEVIVTTGGSEAILFAMLAICDPGDEILVPEPFYTNYLGFGSAAAVTIRPLSCSVDNGFRLPARADIEKCITERTRAILFSNPGNPTGVVYNRAEMECLGSVASDHGLFLIADEVYREFVYDGADFTSAFHLKGIEDRVVMIDSVSKRFSACGARIGYLSTHNKAIIETALRYGQARLCPATVAQRAAAAAFYTPASYLDNVLTEYHGRRDVLYEALCAIPGVTAHKPEGAFYTVARLPVENAEAFAIWLLTEFRVDNATVMVAPASGFYATPGKGVDEVRIAYVLNQQDLNAAMNILAEGLKAYPG
jgi:aspartate aminotransferase